jgi:hypothetical protein
MNTSIKGIVIKAQPYGYKTICRNGFALDRLPLLKNENGKAEMFCISPNNGRSVVLGEYNDHYLLSKGNGLTYTQTTFINTGEYGASTWGLLLKEQAVRDFNIGVEIEKLGIKTNRMGSVLELDYEYHIPTIKETIKPSLLQYSVECPYRIIDFPFIPKSMLKKELEKWEVLNSNLYKYKHLIATEVMFKNLSIMHSKGILHNAIHSQNYSWALELVDFELGRTPNYPYDNEDYEKQYPFLFRREIMQTLEIINYIAWCLKEKIDFGKITEIQHLYNLSL